MDIIPASQEAEIGRSRIEASLCKKLVGPFLKNKIFVIVHNSNPSYPEGGSRRMVA
jgi:hypothetical protein